MWWGKFARLVPPFVVATLTAWAVLRFLAPTGMFRPTVYELFTNLFMFWDWNGARHWNYVDASYWTIPLQLMAFGVAAWIWRRPLGRGRGLRRLMWGAVVLPLAQWPLSGALGPVYASVVDGFGLYRWQLFVAGVAVWLLAHGRLGRGHGAALLLACVGAHAVQIGSWSAQAGFSTDWWSVLGVGLGVAAMLGAAVSPDVETWLPRRLSLMLSWLASHSYGVFLAHQTLGYVLMLRLQQAWGVGPGLQTAAMLVNGVVLGWLMARWVERPCHRELMRSWDRRARRGRVRNGRRGVEPVADRAGMAEIVGVSVVSVWGMARWPTSPSSPGSAVWSATVEQGAAERRRPETPRAVDRVGGAVVDASLEAVR